MTDTLIARLRDMAFAPYSPKLMLEAADRIEALQAELGRLYREHTEDLDAASDAMEFAEKERDQLRAEVERLTEENGIWLRSNNLAKEAVDRLEARLTALEGREPVEKIEERSADYWASKFPVPLGYKLVKETWESSPPLSQDNPDFIVNPVEYQYAYPDGTWRCSNGDRINGMKPTASRALYATRNSS